MRRLHRKYAGKPENSRQVYSSVTVHRYSEHRTGPPSEVGPMYNNSITHDDSEAVHSLVLLYARPNSLAAQFGVDSFTAQMSED